MKILLLYNDDYKLNSCISEIKNCLSSFGAACDCISDISTKRCEKILRRGDYSSAIVFDRRLAAFAAELKHRARLGTEIICACKDFCCLSAVAKSNCDKYILPHAQLEYQFVSSGISRDKLVDTGYPLSSAELSDKKTSRQEIGLDVDKNNILFLCDGLKVKETKTLIKSALGICRDSFELVALCENKLKARRLTDRFAFHKNVCIVSDTGLYHTLLASCDAIIASPQASSAAQSAVNNIPLVLTKGDCLAQRLNVRFFCDRGMAFSGKSLIDCVSYAVRLCESERLRDNMIMAQCKYFSFGSVEKLCKYVCKN